MDLKTLLNKNDYNKLKIIETLMNSEVPLSKKELGEKINVSNFLIENHLEEIAAIAEKDSFGITLCKFEEKNNNYYSLKKSDDSSLKFILFYLFEQSIDYQILTLLQQKSGCSMTFLSDYFFLSESVLYGHFQHINKFLRTYDIQIKKGRLVGSILDTHYFFYNFYWLTLPLSEIKKRFYKQEMNQFFKFLEQKLEVTFPVIVVIQFHLWTSLFLAYATNEMYLNEFSQEFLMCISKDPLYQTIRQAYFTMNDASAFPGNENFPIHIYIFFTSIYILPTKVIPFYNGDNQLANSEPFQEVIDMQQIVKKQLAKLHIDLNEFPYDVASEIYYLLAQIHHQLLYFKRYISTINTNFFLSAYPFDHRVPKFMHQNAYLLTKEIESFLGIEFDQHTFKSIRYIYLTILKNAEHFSKDKLKIGVFCSASYLRMSLTVQQTQELFRERYNSESTVADPEKHYDLLIADTSYFLNYFNYDDHYILSGVLTLFDLNKITEKLDKIYRRKKVSE